MKTQREPHMNAFFQVPGGTPVIMEWAKGRNPQPVDIYNGHGKVLAEQRAAFSKVLRAVEAEHNQDLRDRAKAFGIGIVHIFDKHSRKGGLTIAYRKVSPHESGVMVAVAVATCSHEDCFSRKLGTSIAIEKFLGGEVIQLPLALNKYEGIAYNVKQAFQALYCSI